jgi:hypothetical protein
MAALNAVRTGAVAILLASCTGDRSMDLDEVLQRHTAARGGAAAIESVQFLQISLAIEEATFRVRGEYAATRDGYMRIDIYDDDTPVFTEALGPDGGWQVRRGGTTAEDLSEEGEQALRRGLFKNLYGLHELPALGYELHHHGPITQDGREFQVLEAKAPDGHVEYLYLGANSFLVERELEKTALHPDVDPADVRQLTLHDEFRKIAGVAFAHRSRTVDLDQDTVIQSTVITRIGVNEAYDEARFRRP